MATLAKSTRTTTSTLASASAGPFLLGFRLFDADWLEVYVNGAARTDFTLSATFVDGYDDNTSITFTSDLAAADELIIYGAMVADRESDYANGDPNLVSKMNQELPRHAAMLQEAQRDIGRTLRATTVLPVFNPVASSLLGFGSDGSPLAYPISGYSIDLYSTPDRSLASATVLASQPDGTFGFLAGLKYLVDSTETTYSATADLGAPGLVPASIYTPEHFGAAGDGATADGAAFNRMADAAKDAQAHCGGVPGSKYLIDESVWLGLDDASVGIRSFNGNGAVVTTTVNNEPIFDFTGIQNGLDFETSGWRIENFNDTNVPTCAFLFARPAQASGTVSSGNAIVHGNMIYGHFSVACIYDVQSESNTFRENMLFNYRSSGHSAALVRHDYFEDMFCLEYDAETSPFAGGLVVTGGTSGATAKIIRPTVDLGGSTGRMWVHVTSGTFVDNETITDSATGSATANIPDGYDKIGTASPHAALGVDEDSTSSLARFYANYFNTAEATNDDATLFISDWIDVQVTNGNNFNQANSAALYGQCHIQQDQTRDAAEGTGVFLHEGWNYHHAGHAASVTFGDPVSGGGSYAFNILQSLTSGTPGTMSARVKCISSSTVATLNSSSIVYDHKLDLTNCTATGNNRFECLEAPTTGYGGFIGGALTEGMLHIDSAYRSAVTRGSTDKMVIYYTDVGLTEGPTRQNISLSGTTLPFTFGTNFRCTSTGSVTRITLPSGIRATDIFSLRSFTGQTLTIQPGTATSGDDKGIDGLGDVTVPIGYPIYLRYEPVVDKMIVVGAALATGEIAATGFVAMAGTATKDASGLDTATVTTAQLAEVVKAMLDGDMAIGTKS